MDFPRVLNNPRAALVVFSLAFLPAAYWFWQARHLEHLGYFHDDGMYLLGAKTLAESGAYRIPNLPETPAQTKYPPLFPLLLSLVWRWDPGFPENLPWMLLATWLMLPFNAWLMVRLLESWGCTRSRALCVTAWTILNPYIVFFSVNLMAELMVSILTAGCLLAAQRATRASGGAVAGILAGAAYLTKTAALPLLAAVPVCLAWKRRWRVAAAVAVPGLLALGAWNLWASMHRMSPRDAVETYYLSYLGDFFYDFRVSDLPLIVRVNVSAILASAGNLLVPNVVDFPVLGSNFSRLLGIFAIAGIVRQARRSAMQMALGFAIGYAVLIIAWIYPPNERFLIPLVPLIAFGAQAELTHLLRLLRASWQTGKRDQRIAVGVFGTVMFATAGWAAAMIAAGHLVLLPATLQRNRRQAESNLRVYEWIRANVPEGGRVMADHDAALFLYTGRSAIRPPTFPKLFYRQDGPSVRKEMEMLPRWARSRAIEYWLIAETDLDDDPFLQRNVDFDKLTAGPPFRLLFQAPMARLYQIE